MAPEVDSGVCRRVPWRLSVLSAQNPSAATTLPLTGLLTNWLTN
jgi:hypothetical protein